MVPAASLVVHRGKQVPLSTVYAITVELLGGHLRPDAELLVAGSAPVRVDREADATLDPLAGTIRVLHFSVPEDCDGIFTDLSRIALRRRFGFPEQIVDEALTGFGAFGLDPIAASLSRFVGRTAALYQFEGAAPLGAYSVFDGGRRLVSACYRPGESYATWDGRELLVSPIETTDPPPDEGDYTDFPLHGLQLLFGKLLSVTHAERLALLPSLRRATRPPTQDAEGMRLVEDGRFLIPPREPQPEEWDRFTRSFVG